MKILLPGLRKYSQEVFPQQKPLFENLSLGQTPHTLLITCSDSRIDPNLVTQSQPGEMFVVRNAGSIIPPFGASRGGEEAAIEFAIEGLRVSNIVVCGHYHCGAMSALMGKSDIDSMPSVKEWLRHAQSTKRRMKKADTEISMNEVAEENILVQVDNLKTHPAVSAALAEKRVRIFGWVYQFETGAVSIFDRQRHAYVPSITATESSGDDISRYAL
jgi:carbonic anhydrase